MTLVTDNGVVFDFWTDSDLAPCVRCKVRTTGKLRRRLKPHKVESACRTCAPILAEVKARKEMVR